MALTTNPFAWLKASDIKKVDISKPLVPLVLQPKVEPKKMVWLKPSDIKKVSVGMDAIPTKQVETKKSDYDTQVSKQKELTQKTFESFWELSEKEIKFMKLAKSQWLSMDDAVSFVEQKRIESAPKPIWEKIIQWWKDIVGGIYKSAQAIPTLWEKAGDVIARGILWKQEQERIKAKMWPSIQETTQDILDKWWVNQESTAFKASKWVWDFAQQYALGSMIPWLWKLKNVWTLGKMWVWAVEWAIGTQASSLIEKWKFASAKDTAIGAGIWTLARGIQWKLQAKQVAREKLLMPSLTAWEKASRASQWLANTNIFWKVSYLPSSREKQIAQDFRKIFKPGKTVVTNINRARTEVSKETDNLINIVKDKNVVFNPKEITSRMRKLEKPLMIRWWENESKYDAVIKKFEDILSKKPKNAVWLLEARKELDWWINAEIPNLYNSDTMTPLKVAITKIRKVPNDWLNEQIGDDIVKQSLSKQNQLLDAIDNLSTKVEWEWSNVLSRWIKRNPAKAKAIWWGSIALWWYALWNKWWSLPTNISE